MFAYSNNNPINYVDPTGTRISYVDVLRSSCFMSRNESLGGGAAAGIAGTFFFFELITKLSKRNVKNKETQISSSTAGGTASPKPPKKGNSSPLFEGSTLYNKDGIRIDYEYNGNSSGNVHLHKNGVKYYYDSINNVFRTGISISSALAPKAIQELLFDPKIQRAVTRGIEIIQSLGG